MTDTKHTPGPYRNVDGVIYCGELVIARMCIDRGPRTGDLLAAAPELLEVVQAMATFDGRNNNAHLKEMARSALAKAKGESK